MATLEIPLQNLPKIFSVVLSGSTYVMRIYYADIDMGGWFLDIADGSANPLANGIPMLPGQDLLGQYKYLGMKGQLTVINDLNKSAMPSWDQFPDKAHLVWIEDVS